MLENLNPFRPKNANLSGDIKLVTGSEISQETARAVTEMLDITAATAIFMDVLGREIDQVIPIDGATITIVYPGGQLVIQGGYTDDVDFEG